MDRYFTLDEAKALIPELVERADRIVPIRAELASLLAGQRRGEPVPVPEVKALEARLSEELDWFTERDIHVKGHAPLLFDFPMRTAAGDVFLCWLEGDRDLEWFHAVDQGFAGRRPISELS